MSDEMRENIKNSVRCKCGFFAEEIESPRQAYFRILDFCCGVQYGSQDAELLNFTNALIEEYRMKLICTEV
jgi:hypothetical protein